MNDVTAFSTLRRDQRESALTVMAMAFASDPLFVTIFSSHPATIRAFLAFMFDKTNLSGGRVLVVTEDNQLCGCMLVEPPERPGVARRAVTTLVILGRFLPVALRLPVASIKALNDYLVQTRRAVPSGDFAYLSMIGVRPEFQGRGLGRPFVEIAVDEAHGWGANGIALDTENPDNVPMYEHFGFQMGAVIDLGRFTSYCMYRRFGR